MENSVYQIYAEELLKKAAQAADRLLRQISVLDLAAVGLFVADGGELVLVVNDDLERLVFHRRPLPHPARLWSQLQDLERRLDA